jgi:hypothetical protein
MIAQAAVQEVILDRQISQLAYQFWMQRGCPFGTPDTDWLHAEEKLRRDIEPLCQSNFTASLKE